MLLALLVVALLLFACTLLLLLPLLTKVLLLMLQAPLRVPTHLHRGAQPMHSRSTLRHYAYTAVEGGQQQSLQGL
jgi:hypothetical protein